jgi:hypothetical protein
MALLLVFDPPAGITREFLEDVTAEMNVRNDPPDGLVSHVVTERNGRAQVVDVWESQDALDRFNEARLMPAMAVVAKRRGVDLTTLGQTEPQLSEAHDVIVGKLRTTA